MKKAVLLYSSREGQTKKILARIEQELVGYECETLDLHHLDTIDLDSYQKVVVGASIRYGKLNKALYSFIDKHLEQLRSSKAAFFCVNLTARKEDQGKDNSRW